jgi:hypothetical protein
MIFIMTKSFCQNGKIENTNNYYKKPFIDCFNEREFYRISLIECNESDSLKSILLSNYLENINKNKQVIEELNKSLIYQKRKEKIEKKVVVLVIIVYAIFKITI